MTRTIAWLLALALLSGCRSAPPEAHDHEPPTIAVTRHTERAELFAEFPPLVADAESPVAAHWTELPGWTPARTGRLEAVLTGPDGRAQTFVAETPARPGIYRPVLRPAAPGRYTLAFRRVLSDRTEIVALGPVEVHADAEAAHHAAEEADHAHDAGDAVTFLKEQQWRMPFRAEPVEVAALEVGLPLTGSVVAAHGREVAVAAPAHGRLAIGRGRLPRLGERVAAGTVLAWLTPSEEPGQDRASLAEESTRARTELALAKKALARAERLYAAAAAPLRQLEEARAAVTVAEARVEATADHLAAKLETLSGAAAATPESYALKSPIGGTVVAVSAVPGAYVEEGAALYRVVDLARVWVEARAPEADLQRVAKARAAEVTVPGVEARRASLVTVGHMLDAASRSAPVVFEAANADGALRIGMSASVRVLMGKTPVGPVVPASAVVDDGGVPIAYVQTDGEHFERRALTLGVRQGDRVQVTSGLAAGERVVTLGAYEVRLASKANALPAHGHEH